MKARNSGPIANRLSLALTLAAATLFTGCVTPLPSSREALLKLKKGEGIILGSAFVNRQDSTNDSPERFQFQIRRREGHELSTIYTLDVALDQEHVFIGKLPKGEYAFDGLRVLRQGGFLLNLLAMDDVSYTQIRPEVTFRVQPGKTTYIGKLTLTVPWQIRDGSQGTAGVENQREQAVKTLHEAYAEMLTTIHEELMTAWSQPIVFQLPESSPTYGYTPIFPNYVLYDCPKDSVSPRSCPKLSVGPTRFQK